MKLPITSRWFLLSAASGILAGVAATVFLYALAWATQTRETHPALIWALPCIGFAIGWAYHVYGRDVAPGNNLILDEIHDPRKVVPLRMAPLILIGTVLTHLFGGSAGREGTAVQMGASLSDQLSRVFRVGKEERKILLIAGAGAGFGAAIAAPLAGTLFGLEMLRVGRLRFFALVECFIASMVGYYTTILLHAPHSVYPRFPVPALTPSGVLWIAVAGACFGLSARAFIWLTHQVERWAARAISFAPARPVAGGALVTAGFLILGTYRYAGLGIPVIQDALNAPAEFRDPLLKGVFTALTIGSGFKGGEFIPLVFIGATLGSALSVILPLAHTVLAAVGFAAVFAGAANTPLACSVMAMEIFGFSVAPYALIGCFVSYWFSGTTGIYKSQRDKDLKHRRIKDGLKWLGKGER